MRKFLAKIVVLSSLMLVTGCAPTSGVGEAETVDKVHGSKPTSAPVIDFVDVMSDHGFDVSEIADLPWKTYGTEQNGGTTYMVTAVLDTAEPYPQIVEWFEGTFSSWGEISHTETEKTSHYSIPAQPGLPSATLQLKPITILTVVIPEEN